METAVKKIAVLSGKGGTGKTFISVNLASIIDNAAYIDCDVEEPNGDLFFKSKNIEKQEVFVKIPKVDMTLCNGCQKCVDFCKFNALTYLPNKLLIFDKLCHSCGGCVLVCDKKALTEINKEIGNIYVGKSSDVFVVSGKLNIGEATGVPIIKQLFKYELPVKNIVVDCPPGSSCLVMETIKDADYCLFVVEPTIFGLHNFKMVLELVKLFNKPFGVVINKYSEESENNIKYFYENNIKIIKKIKYDKLIVEMNSSGLIVSRMFPEYKSLFTDIFEEIKRFI